MALAGLTLDRPCIYGKKWTLLSVEWTISGGSGAVSAVKGSGFSTQVARPHQGSVARTDTGDYTITLPGDGGTFFLIQVVGVSVVGETLACTVQAVDLSDGTVDLTFHGADTADASIPVDPADASRIQVTLLVSDWPHL